MDQLRLITNMMAQNVLLKVGNGIKETHEVGNNKVPEDICVGLQET